MCAKHNIPHIVNNAYGVQSSKCMHLIQQVLIPNPTLICVFETVEYLCMSLLAFELELTSDYTYDDSEDAYKSYMYLL